MPGKKFFGYLLFIVGAFMGILDLLNALPGENVINPFYGALALMIAGIALVRFDQAGES